MVQLSACPALSRIENLTLYHTADPELSDSPFLVFTGPAQATGASSLASSRIQSHVFSAAGPQSYARLVISPGSHLYAAVSCLPRQEQGDEVCRVLAYSIFKYLSELPDNIKELWVKNTYSGSKPSGALELFTEAHAARLATQMRKAPDTIAIAKHVESNFAPQCLSTVDVDLVLPKDSMRRTSGPDPSIAVDDASIKYGPYADIVALFGDPAFIPNSKIRRAPSRPLPSNRSAAFAKCQKEALRREICELLDTEESYVFKLDQFIKDTATAFRRQCQPGVHRASASDLKAVATLFPSSLDCILSTNSSFFKALLAAVESTEADAIEDIESSNSGSRFVETSVDPTGALLIAECLLEWLPAFRDCYFDYITAHAEFGNVLKSLASDRNSAFHTIITETGEQKLLSLLIEPVQRLPRYSLYLENIIKQLPARHPALPSFLRAKDLVADLCAQDTPSGQNATVIANLRRRVGAWPSTLLGKSRLISAADLVEETPGAQSHEEFIALLFTSHLILVSKKSTDSLSAHGLLAEVESSASTPADENKTIEPREQSLVFEDSVQLADISMYEAASGSVIRLAPLVTKSEQTAVSGSRCKMRQFTLHGAYAERASRFTREFARARAEGRFPEPIRESSRWEVRELEADNAAGLSLVSAIFEDGAESNFKITAADIRITLDSSKMATPPTPPGSTYSILASISSEGNGFYRLEVASSMSQTTKDFITSAEFVPVLQKRLGTLLQMHSSLRNPSITTALMEFYEQNLHALHLPKSSHGRSLSKSKVSRPHSPVKALTNLFGGASKDNGTIKKAAAPAPTLSHVPLMRPQLGPKATSESEVAKVADHKVTMIRGSDANGDAISHLEDCLTNYLLALRARKGNVVGRIISNRAFADRDAIDLLVNAVNEQPEDHEAAANSSVDVLFAAFEQFIKTSWHDRLGPIIGLSMLDELQYKASILSPFDYEDYLQMRLDDLAPQNRRAFRGILETFIDLLGSMSSDADRGTLMATMTEIIVSEGRPHDYMSIFDRFIEEHDTILHGDLRSGNTTPYQNSLASSTANRSAHTNSLSSKASSLGRRFGLTSSVDNGKAAESKFGSVIRSMSKSSRTADGSIRDKHGLGRPKSIEFSANTSNSRPQSRDALSFVGSVDEGSSRPGTGHSCRQGEQLEVLAEASVQPKSLLRKKKRRSSLSDLEHLPLPNTSPFWNNGTPSVRRPTIENSPLAPRGLNMARDSGPQLTPNVETRGQLSTPLRRAGTVTGSPNIPPRRIYGATSPVRQPTVSEKTSEKKENVPPTTPERMIRVGMASATRGILVERQGSDNTSPSAQGDVFDGSPMKNVEFPASIARKRIAGQLSPQKLCERVQTQQTALSSAESSLRDELAKIGNELAALNVSVSPSKPGITVPDSMAEGIPTPRKTSATLQNISGRLKALEARVPHMVGSLARQVDGLQKDIAAVQVQEEPSKSDARVRELERQLQQSRDENGLMARRHDDEIRRLYEQHRRGRQQSEMERKMCDAMDETARCREEMSALQRENAALRAQLNHV